MSYRIRTIINGELRKVSPDFFNRANEYRAGRNQPLLRELSDNEVALHFAGFQDAPDTDPDDARESPWLSTHAVDIFFWIGIALCILIIVGLSFGIARLWMAISSPSDLTWMDWMSDHRAAMIGIETGLALLWGMLS